MKKLVICLTAALLLAASGARAADPQGWKFEVTPYAWLAGVEGDITVNGQTADFEKSFGDLFDAVNVAGSVLATVQYNRFIFWAQGDYFSLSTDNLDVEDRPAGGSVDTKMTLGEAAFGYQVDGWMEGQTFDLLVGVRTLHIENDLDVAGVGTFEKTNDLVDPILVVRPSVLLFPSKLQGRLRFNPTLAIGGGGDSDLVYELQPQIQYNFTDNVSARFGYRRVGYKFKGENNEDNELNVRLAGLILGLGVRF